jgi:hypothetical protein
MKLHEAMAKIFGDKVIIGPLVMTPEEIADFKAYADTKASDLHHFYPHIAPEKWEAWEKAIPTYDEQVWLLPNTPGQLDYVCPVCKAPLFLAFAWNLEHGVGFCTSCKEVDFLVYHYPLWGEGLPPIQRWAICGLSKRVFKKAGINLKEIED